MKAKYVSHCFNSTVKRIPRINVINNVNINDTKPSHASGGKLRTDTPKRIDIYKTLPDTSRPIAYLLLSL